MKYKNISLALSIVVCSNLLFDNLSFAENNNKKTSTNISQNNKEALNKELYFSIKRNDFKKVKELIDKGVSVNQSLTLDGNNDLSLNIEDYSPLMLAVSINNNDIVKLLIEKGANTNFKNTDCKTPLSISLENKNNNLSKLLIDKGAKYDLISSIIIQDLEKVKEALNTYMVNEQSKALTLAVSLDNKEIIELLLSKNVVSHTEYKYVLEDLVGDNDVDLVKVLLKYKNNFYISRYPLVSIGVNSHNIDIIKLLIDNGFDLNSSFDGFDTPTSIALNNNYYDILELLLKNKANLEGNNRNIFEKGLEGNNENIFQKALERNDKKAVYLIAKHGLDINKEYQNLSEINFSVKELLELGLNTNAKNSNGDSLLIKACKEGDKEGVQLLIDKNLNINEQDSNGFTPLMHSIKSNKLEVIDLFIKNKVNLELRNKDGESSLLLALNEKKDNIANLLIKSNYDVNSIDNDGDFDLLYASFTGNKTAVEYLLSKGADINKSNKDGFTSLLTAVLSGKLELIDFLISKGSNINVLDKEGDSIFATFSLQENKNKAIKENIENYLISKGFSYDLHSLVRLSDLKRIKEIISKGADINSKNNKGSTPLIEAIKHSNKDTINFLISKGAKIDIKDKNNLTPLYYAIEANNKAFVNLFIDKGANIKIKTSEGLTPLAWAVDNNYTDTVKKLISKGVNVNEKNSGNTTPLMLASFNGNKDIVKLLISKGAKVNEYDIKGRSALNFSIMHDEIPEILIKAGAKYSFQDSLQIGDYKTVKNFLDKGTNPNTKFSNGETPLNIACISGSKDIIKLLISKGANVNQKDEKGFTPLMITAMGDPANILKSLSNLFKGEENENKEFIPKKENLEIASLLISKGAKLNDINSQGDTPLICASYVGNYPVAKLLVDKGANINIKNKSNVTALDACKMSGNSQIEDLLSE